VSTRPDLPSYRTLLMDVDRGVAIITLNRPGRASATPSAVACARSWPPGTPVHPTAG
jgi:hypothetical protein